jgi:membrane fusion protein (multidrug efflux system)
MGWGRQMKSVFRRRNHSSDLHTQMKISGLPRILPHPTPVISRCARLARCRLALPSLCTVIVASVLAACTPEAQSGAGRKPEQAAPVVTTEVRTREYGAPLEAIGTVRALESVVVTSRVSGRVKTIYMEEGAEVTLGTPLVLLEDDEERSQLRSAKATAAQASSRFQRMQELASRGLISMDDLEAQRRIVDTTEAALDLAQVMLEQRTIRAPFAGTVGFRQVSPGSLVQPGTGIVTLDATATIRVAFSVPETRISDIGRGNPVRATAAAYPGGEFIGKIDTIGTRVNEATRAIPIQALIRNPDNRLKPGMLLTLSLEGRPRPIRYVPESAVAPENARQFAWRIKADNSAEKVAVELGVRAKGWVEIVSGLEVGDRVVLEGIANLRPGRGVLEVPRPRDGAGPELMTKG